MTVVTGSTWEDFFDYLEGDGVTPIDLTGYQARMHIRTQDNAYGLATSSTLLLALLSAGASPKLFIEIPPGGTVKNRVRIKVDVADHRVLNPNNDERLRLAYGMELYIPAGANPEYVIPYIQGAVQVRGGRVH